MALIIASIIAGLSLLLGLIGAFASANSPTGTEPSGVAPYVIGGLVFAGLVAASHWAPHISW